MEVMLVPSHVLVLDPRKNAEIEQALRHPRFDVCFATGTEEALNLVPTLMPAVIVLDLLAPGLDAWKLISRIFEMAGKRPAVILLTDQVGTMEAANLGRVRLSDREHLGETFKDAVNALEKPPPDLSDDAVWDSVMARVKAEGDARFAAEMERMRRLGLVDERGKAISKEWPADMAPDSKTDVAG